MLQKLPDGGVIHADTHSQRGARRSTHAEEGRALRRFAEGAGREKGREELLVLMAGYIERWFELLEWFSACVGHAHG